MNRSLDEKIRQYKEDAENSVLVQASDMTVEMYLIKLASGEAYFPDYQRDFIWDTVRQSRFIESMLLGYPTPNMIFFEDDDGRLEVADGRQRITTLKGWMENDLILEGLKEMSFLNGVDCNDLGPVRRRKMGNTVIRSYIIKAASGGNVPLNKRLDIFDRINTQSAAVLPEGFLSK